MTSRYDHYLDLIDEAARLDIGYDQGQRFSYLDLRHNRLLNHSEADCSALSLGLAKLAGYPIDMTPPVWTGSARAKTTAIGWKAIPVFGMGHAQIQSMARHGGIMLVNEAHHIITQTRNVGWWLSANIDEKGGAAGGRAGDQTGHEVSLRQLWDYSHGGWSYLLVPNDIDGSVPYSGGSTPTEQAQALPQQKITLKLDAAKRLQHVLKVAEDGIIGPMTIGAWQARMGTTADRVVNLPSALVKAVQVYLNHARDNLIKDGRTVSASWTTLVVDGEWGPRTQDAIEEYLLHWNGGFSR